MKDEERSGIEKFLTKVDRDRAIEAGISYNTITKHEKKQIWKHQKNTY